MINRMSNSFKKPHLRTALLPLIAVFCLTTTLSAQAQWYVEDAPIRFVVHPGNAPTKPSCAYYVELPDGGILPGPIPNVVATDDAGRPIKAYTMWHNPAKFLGVLFERPKTGSPVHMYVKKGEAYKSWTPATGLTPSGLLAQWPHRRGFDTCAQIAKLGRMGPKSSVYHNVGGENVSLAVCGDFSGRRGGLASYILVYLNVNDPGKIWFSATDWNGKSRNYLNGKFLDRKEKVSSKKIGGRGNWVNLPKGMARYDIHHHSYWWWCLRAPRRGLTIPIWRTPNTSVGQLGGLRPDDLPFPGTTMWEARRFGAGEVNYSGRAKVVEVKRKDNGPVARINMWRMRMWWYADDEPPVAIYQFNAITTGNPEGTKYTWSFGGNTKVKGKSCKWIMRSWRDHQVTLTATLGEATSTATTQFYPYAGKAGAIDSGGDRRLYRQELYNMCMAYPAGEDPTAHWTTYLNGDEQSKRWGVKATVAKPNPNWDKVYWNNVFRTIDLGLGQKFLTRLVTKHWKAVQPKLNVPQREVLEDMFLGIAGPIDAHAAIEYTRKFEKATESKERKGLMAIRRAEYLMYYLDNPEAAKRQIQGLANTRSASGDLAAIRLGDIEFMSGNMNEAMKYYGFVQSRTKQKINTGAIKAPESRIAKAVDEPASVRKENAYYKQLEEEEAKKKRTVARVEPWKAAMVLEVNRAETVKSYIKQGALLEAYDMLLTWERQFPMSKINGDFMIWEAKLYMKLGDYKRAKKILTAYVDQVDASSYMSAAVRDLLTCMVSLKEPQKDIREYCEKTKKRMMFHPVAVHIDGWLTTILDYNSTSKRDATID